MRLRQRIKSKERPGSGPPAGWVLKNQNSQVRIHFRGGTKKSKPTNFPNSNPAASIGRFLAHSRDANRISKRPDQMDNQGQEANKDELFIHGTRSQSFIVRRPLRSPN